MAWPKGKKRGFKTPGSGKQAGTHNKNTQQLRDMILGALDKVGGEAYLAQQATESPSAFLTLIGRVLPTTLAGDPEAPVRLDVALRPKITREEWLDSHAVGPAARPAK